MSLSLLTRKARLQALADQIDANGGGSVELYGLPMATAPEVAASTPVLAVVTLAVPCGLVADALGLATLILEYVVGNASTGGTIAWARFVDGAGTAVYDAEAGLPGSGKPVTVTDGQPIPTATVYAGGEVQIASATWYE